MENCQIARVKAKKKGGTKKFWNMVGDKKEGRIKIFGILVGGTNPGGHYELNCIKIIQIIKTIGDKIFPLGW